MSFAGSYGTLCDIGELSDAVLRTAMVRQIACPWDFNSMSQAKTPADLPEQSVDTRLVTVGRDPNFVHGFVNTPVMHGSTVLYATAADLRNELSKFSYGREGTATTQALSSALQALEGPNCAGVALLPSGLA